MSGIRNKLKIFSLGCTRVKERESREEKDGRKREGGENGETRRTTAKEGEGKGKYG